MRTIGPGDVLTGEHVFSALLMQAASSGIVFANGSATARHGFFSVSGRACTYTVPMAAETLRCGVALARVQRVAHERRPLKQEPGDAEAGTAGRS